MRRDGLQRRLAKRQPRRIAGAAGARPRPGKAGNDALGGLEFGELLGELGALGLELRQPLGQALARCGNGIQRRHRRPAGGERGDGRLQHAAALQIGELAGVDAKPAFEHIGTVAAE